MNDHSQREKEAGSQPQPKRMGERAHRLGVLTNAGLALIKIVGGLAAASPALVADGWHSIADLLTTLVAWGSFRLAAEPADEDHHYGHGKREAVAGVAVGAILALGGGVLLWRLGTGASHPLDGASLRPELAIGVAIVSIAANEWLARLTGRAGRLLRSQVLLAVSRDNRADALSSLLVIVGVGGRLIGWSWAEPGATALIALGIIAMGMKSMRESGDVLVDRVTDPTLRRDITRAAQAVEGVLSVDLVRVHPIGSSWAVDVEICVNGELTVREGHEIAHAVEAALTKARDGIVTVQVHVNAQAP